MPGLIMAVGTAWKRALYLGFLFLLVALKQRIVAVPPLCWGAAADTQTEEKSFSGLQFPGQVCGQACQAVGISVSAVFAYMCAACVHTYSITTVGKTFFFCQLQQILPFTDGSQIQNGWCYFKLLILKLVTCNTGIIAEDSQTRCEPFAQWGYFLVPLEDCCIEKAHLYWACMLSHTPQLSKLLRLTLWRGMCQSRMINRTTLWENGTWYITRIEPSAKWLLFCHTAYSDTLTKRWHSRLQPGGSQTITNYSNPPLHSICFS